ncbi:zinc finger protein RFP-like [Platysternon megacephalum]|uniref:Zinc finger protein RFP-like n=1 Tax=Platysternon megacephalum TaxID=55544 RepID=A0A4D9DR04_9SAUR|nr:zinc finger protein RFP-like [Platysternon megacephalum]
MGACTTLYHWKGLLFLYSLSSAHMLRAEGRFPQDTTQLVSFWASPFSLISPKLQTNVAAPGQPVHFSLPVLWALHGLLSRHPSPPAGNSWDKGMDLCSTPHLPQKPGAKRSS